MPRRRKSILFLCTVLLTFLLSVLGHQVSFADNPVSPDTIDYWAENPWNNSGTLSTPQNEEAPAPESERIQPPSKRPLSYNLADKTFLQGNYSFDPNKRAVVLVDKAAFRTYILQLEEDGLPHSVYSIPNAHGRVDSPTPTGRFEVERVVIDPYWRNRWTGEVIAPYSRTNRNPMGVAAIPLTADVGLHGTNNPEAIGTRVSSGCIRHHNWDIMPVTKMVFTGTAAYLENSVGDNTNLQSIDFMWEYASGVEIQQQQQGNQEAIDIY